MSGLALLIDIERYENDVQEQRIGSDVDVENLSQLLKGLEFDVAVHRNLHLAAFFKVGYLYCQLFWVFSRPGPQFSTSRLLSVNYIAW